MWTKSSIGFMLSSAAKTSSLKAPHRSWSYGIHETDTSPVHRAHGAERRQPAADVFAAAARGPAQLFYVHEPVVRADVGGGRHAVEGSLAVCVGRRAISWVHSHWLDGRIRRISIGQTRSGKNPAPDLRLDRFRTRPVAADRPDAHRPGDGHDRTRIF